MSVARSVQSATAWESDAPTGEGPVRRRGLLFLREQVTHTPGGRARDAKIGDNVNRFMWDLDKEITKVVLYGFFLTASTWLKNKKIFI